MTIEAIFENSNIKSDKVPRHGYQRFYPYFLDPFRQMEGVKVLEIGFYEGDSVDLWKNYFNKPKLYVLDIMDNIVHESLERVYQVDQSDLQQINDFVEKVDSSFDIIVDDGSHIPKHQWQTFIRLFPILNDGGVYIIEDIETSYWGKSCLYGYHFDSNDFSIFTKLNSIIDLINREFQKEDIQTKHSLSDIEYKAISQVEMIALGHNCIMIKKRNQKLFSQYYRDNKDYKWKDHINKELQTTSEESLINVFRNFLAKCKRVLRSEKV